MKRVLHCALAGLFLAVTSQSIFAQVVPFKASGTGAEYDPFSLETFGPGKATHLGKMIGTGKATPGVEVGPGLFTWSADNYILTGANGDEIYFTGGGLVQFIPIPDEVDLFYAVWVGEFHVTGGSGRFSNVGPASEPIAVEAINNPFVFPPSLGDTWTYDWTLTGEIDLGKKKKK